MRLGRIILAAVIGTFNLCSCEKKTASTQVEDQKFTDILTVQQDSVLIASSTNNPSFNTMMGAGGDSLKIWFDNLNQGWYDTLNNLRLNDIVSGQVQYHTLINKLISAAHVMADKKNIYIPMEALHKPEQWGIAYSLGSNNHTSRGVPPAGNDLHMQDAVLGLDCGGFIETIFKTAGISSLKDFESNQFPDFINRALPTSPYPDLELVNMGVVVQNEMEPGDIVIWRNHIGMISFNFPLTEPFVYQSNGTGFPEDKLRNGLILRTAANDQKNNQGKERGVHPIKWSTSLSNDYWPGGYRIWRLKEKKCDKPLDIQQRLDLTGGNKKAWYLYSLNGVSQPNAPGCPFPYNQISVYHSNGTLESYHFTCDKLFQTTITTYNICDNKRFIGGEYSQDVIISLSQSQLIYKSDVSNYLGELRPL